MLLKRLLIAMNLELSCISGIDDALIAFEIMFHDYVSLSSLDASARLITSKCYNVCGFKENIVNRDFHERLSRVMKLLSSVYSPTENSGYADIVKMIQLTLTDPDSSISDVLNMMCYSAGDNALMVVDKPNGFPDNYAQLVCGKIFFDNKYVEYICPWAFDARTATYKPIVSIDGVMYEHIGLGYVRKSFYDKWNKKTYALILKLNLHNFLRDSLPILKNHICPSSNGIPIPLYTCINIMKALSENIPFLCDNMLSV